MIMIFVRALFFSLLFVLMACEDKPYQSYPVPKDYQRPETPTLSYEEAKLRSQTVKNVEYFVQIDLTKSQRYSGFVEIKFNYTPSPFPLTIDFVRGEAEQINVNNIIIPINYMGNFINIPSEQLEPGTNIIKVQFSHAYSDNGTGLYRYTDPIDEKSYLYSNFEPYYANRLFPVFDQPDMLSSYKLKVVTPKNWTVVSSVRESDIIEDGPYKRWHFPQSPKISSYAFSLHAGPWHIWEGKSGKIPLRLMTRQSLASQIDVREWFKITQLGFRFYQKYLAIPYPYSKYDQLIVPDANIDGNVNSGGAIFSEELVPRTRVTNARKSTIAGVILRELSQMWFGNLLSIEWWSDLWIKDSLAHFLSPLAQAEATEYKDAWNSFYIHTKQQAYKADQSITSHPVNSKVLHSISALANYDQITSSKGAALLQQLSYYLGENTFRNGLRSFLKEHQSQTINLDDFLKGMEAYSGKQLEDWFRTWINTAGVNTLKVEYQCENGKIRDFSLIQTTPGKFPVMREQLLQVALYSKVESSKEKSSKVASSEIENQIKATTVLAVSIHDKKTEIQAFTDQPCPLLVYPNYGNWGYIKVNLDNKTQLMLDNNIGNIDDPLARAMFWQALWEQVIDLKMPLNQYLQLLFNNLTTETNSNIIRALLSNLVQANSWINKTSPADQKAKAIIESFEDLLLRSIQLAEDSSDEQKIWFHYFLKIVQTDDSLTYLSKWLQGERQPKALNSDPDIRWNALIRLSIFNHPDLEPLLKLEQFHDKSEQALVMALAVKASRPDPDIKAYWMDELTREDDRQSAVKLKQAMKYLFPAEQSNIHYLFAPRILQDLYHLDGRGDQELIRSMVSSLLPVLCSADSVAILKEELENMTDLGLIAQNALLNAHQENKHCLAINQAMTKSLQQ